MGYLKSPTTWQFVQHISQLTTEKTLKLRITDPLWWDPGFPSVTRKVFPFHNVIRLSLAKSRILFFMMTSSNGNIFRVTGHLFGSSVNSPHKCQWRGALMFSFIWAWINGWVNNREAGDLRRHRAHYGVTVMQAVPSHEALLQKEKSQRNLPCIYENTSLNQFRPKQNSQQFSHDPQVCYILRTCNFPADTQRKNNVIITPNRRREFDVIIMLLLRHVSVGFVSWKSVSFPALFTFQMLVKFTTKM